MTELKKGDRVRVNRLDATIKAFGKGSHMDEMIGKTCTVSKVGREIEFTEDEHKYSWHWADLELVRDRKAAQILTEKVIICNVPCRKILGFEGILGRDELPGKYLEGKPEFHLVPKGEAYWNIRHFDGSHLVLGGAASEVDCIDFRYEGSPKVEMYERSEVLNVGDIIPDATFQNILIWLKRAGSRLAKIREQEKAAWSGKETVEI
jgi:hypothetical protein